MVARDGVEPPTPAFSDILNQQLNSSGRSIYCDQSVTNYYDQLVTSADVRLASALKLDIDSSTANAYGRDCSGHGFRHVRR